MGATRGRVAIIGCGPGGMAAAISAHQAGHDVALFERYPEARPAGTILNLWPPPIKALRLLGVDTDDLGAPCRSEFRRADGRVRVVVELPDEVEREYGGGGFVGLLRPELYTRMHAALPRGVLRVNRTVKWIEQDESLVRLHFTNGAVHEADVLIGADGIDSLTRRTLWGEAPKREHHLHVLGGYTFDDVPAERGRCIVAHDRTTQGSWTAIRHGGRDGFQWWVLTAHDASTDFVGDHHAEAARLAAPFATPLPQLVAATDPGRIQRWVIRDRPPLEQWTQGRVTLIGDAAHPTSPYAAYNAGMAVEDGYFVGRRLAGVDLRDPGAVREALEAFEAPRRPHTERQCQMAYRLGRMFHHTPAPLRAARDFLIDHTSKLHRWVGEQSPREIVAQLAAIDAAEHAFRTAMA